MQNNIEVSVSILSSDLGNLNYDIEVMKQAGVDRIHVDVMDGHFVPNLSFGAPLVRKMKTDLPVEIHLMVENPEQYLKDYAEGLVIGGSLEKTIVLVHVEAVSSLQTVIEKIKSFGFRVGLVLKPATSVEALNSVIEDLDQVLIMSVELGYSGQKFMPEVLEKIRKLREWRSDLDIEIDGGINAETSVLAREAGANVLVSASYLFGSDDKSKAIRVLKGEV